MLPMGITSSRQTVSFESFSYYRTRLNEIIDRFGDQWWVATLIRLATLATLGRRP